MSTRRDFDVLGAHLGPGITLLEASAGTGKTWSITTLAARAFVEGRLDDIGELLMVTFTKAATDDLRTRLRARLQETLRALLHPASAGDDSFLATVSSRADAVAPERLRRALSDFDRARVHTIHSYCARLLQETAFEAGASLELGEPTDATSLRDEALEDAWRALVVEGPAWLVALAAASGWKPANFASLVEMSARHRRIEIRPASSDLTTVGARVDEVLRRVDDVLDPHAVHAALLPRLGPADDAFPKTWQDAHGSALALALRLLSEHGTDPRSRHQAWTLLASRLGTGAPNKGHRKEIASEPWFAPLEELHRALADVDAALRASMLAHTQERLRRNKEREDKLDFDDLVRRVRAALDDPARRAAMVARVRASTRMACIDEFQDTDVDQWEIFRVLFGEDVTLVLVGDPKQAIYGFRGADVFAYLDARAEVQAGGGTEAGLAHNFRSHPELVRAVNVLFGRGTAAFAIEGITHADVMARRTADERALAGDPGAAFRLLPVACDRSQKPAHERAVIEATVAEIERLLGAGITLATEHGARPLVAGDITVLTRKHHQSTRVHRALREAGIASVLGRTGDVHASEAMEELGLLLEAVLDAADPRVVRRALATRLWGATLSELVRLEREDDALAEVHALLAELRRLWHRHGVLVATDRFVQRRRVAERLLGEEEGDRLLTDLRHSLELVHRAAVENRLSPAGTLHWLWREHGRDHEQDETRQLRLDRDDAAVRILTAHGAKGLEYEIVLVPFAWDRSARSGPLEWHEGERGERRLVVDFAATSPQAPRAARESLSEELRLLYVALTRAKRRCTVLLTAYHDSTRNTAGRSALVYLLHRAGALAQEEHDAYVDRCVEQLAADVDAWTPIVPAWVAEHASIGVQSPPPPSIVPAPIRAEPPTLRVRGLPDDLGTRLVPWSMVSFTSLTRTSRADRETAMVEVEAAEVPVAERSDPSAAARLLRASTPGGIFAFARGARAGVCLHELFETTDFDREFLPTDRARLVRILERHGLSDPRAHDAELDPLAVAEDLLRRAARERFPLGDFALAAIDRSHRLDEWEFRAALGRTRLRDVAGLFERHAGDPWARSLPPRLRRFDDRAVEGLLGGFVDLVFEHRQKWYVVDWKSNHLGDDPEDYHPAAIEDAMLEHDYVVQLTLYTLAVHRFLGQRLPRYDYDAHFGGAAYAFFRGWCGRTDRGWFAWKPPRALIEALDAAWTPGGERR